MSLILRSHRILVLLHLALNLAFTKLKTLVLEIHEYGGKIHSRYITPAHPPLQLSDSLPLQHQHLHCLSVPFIKASAPISIISATNLPIMQLTVLVTALLGSAAVSARTFTLYDNANFGGAAHTETRDDDFACCMHPVLISGTSRDSEWSLTAPGNFNGKGDRASSVRGGGGCTTFFQYVSTFHVVVVQSILGFRY